jgi:hypothetical protein
VSKRLFLRHLYIKTNIVPRQARDKHRENSKKRDRLSSGNGSPEKTAWIDCPDPMVTPPNQPKSTTQGKKPGFLRHLYIVFMYKCLQVLLL